MHTPDNSVLTRVVAPRRYHRIVITPSELFFGTVLRSLHVLTSVCLPTSVLAGIQRFLAKDGSRHAYFEVITSGLQWIHACVHVWTSWS